MASKFITNFVGGTSKSQWAKLGCGFTQNMYLETKDSNEFFYSRVLLPFPGHKHIADVDGEPRGMFTAIGGFGGETAYFVAGTSLYCIHDGEVFKIGGVGYGKVCFAEIRNADRNFLLLSDENSLFAVDMSNHPLGQSLRQVPLPKKVNDDGSYGDNIRPTSVCVCYNMVNVVDLGTDKFYTSVTLPFKVVNGSVDYDIFAVSEAPTSADGGERPYYQVGYYTYAETSADIIEALVTNGTSLFAIGKNSFDRFDYTGVAISKSVLAGIVWKSPRGNGGLYGTTSAESVKVLGGSVYYVARNPRGGKSIVRLGDGLNVVSTPEVESSIGEVISATTFQWGQHPFYVLRFDSTAMAYDVREDVWVSLSTNGSTWEVYDTTPAGDDILIQYRGGYGKFSTDKWTDHLDRPIVRKRSGVITNPNGDEFTLDQVSIVTNCGQYKDSGKDFVAVFRWSEDGMTWEDSGNEVLGRTGQYDRILDVYDLGIGRNFCVEISCSENVPFCIYGIRIDAKICDL